MSLCRSTRRRLGTPVLNGALRSMKFMLLFAHEFVFALLKWSSKGFLTVKYMPSKSQEDRIVSSRGKFKSKLCCSTVYTVCCVEPNYIRCARFAPLSRRRESGANHIPCADPAPLLRFLVFFQ